MLDPEQSLSAVDSSLAARERDRLALIAEASAKLLASLRLDTVLPQALDLAARGLAADAYALWRFDPEARAWDLAAAAGLSEEYRSGAFQAIKGSETQMSAEPMVFEDIANSKLLTDAHKHAHRRERNRSMVAVPLRYHDEVIGTLVFYYRNERTFSAPDLETAEMLGNLTAAAVGAAQLYEAQSRMAEARRFVAESSELLASSLDYEATLANVAALAVPQFADWCSIDLLSDTGSLERLAVAHADPAKVRWANELAERYPPDPDAPVGVPNVLRTGQPELVSEVTDELLVEATKDTPELLEVLRELGLRSSLCVPLTARGRTLGAITFVSAESGHLYGQADLATALDLGRRAGIAVDNAHLFRESTRTGALLDAMLATAPVGLGFWDRDLRFVRINEALAEINGPSIEAHLGRTVREVVPDLAPTLEPLFEQVLEGKAFIELEVSGETPAAPGRERHWLASYYPVTDESGSVLGVGAVIAEITERKRIESERAALEERLSVLAEASTALTSSLDYETTLANIATLLVPRFADWYAVDVVEDDGSFRRLAVVHRDPDKAHWAERSQRHYPAIPGEPEGPGKVVRTGAPALYPMITDELLMRSTQNSDHLEVLRELGMESAMVVPLAAGGRTFGTLMLVSADPARRYDDDALQFAHHLARRAAVAVDNARLYRAAEERAQAALALEHVSDGVLLIDRAGIVRLWNPAAAAITGLKSTDVVGQRATSPFPTWESFAAQVPAAGPGMSRPATLPVEVGGRELWLSIGRVDFPGGAVFAFRDVTDERALERLKSDFVATVSHELRTPLAAIYGAALTLRRDDYPLQPAQRAGLLEVIAGESNRLARIINDILWASRLESGTMQVSIQRCDGVALAKAVVDAAAARLPPNLRLELAADDDLPRAAADPDKVAQVLTNLVDNAIKYSPDGGKIDVNVGAHGSGLRFRVSDQGLGVPSGEYERIFEKFFRLDPNLTRGVGGTGLGLYISRELVRRMDGRVWVEPNNPRGSIFVVELPLAGPD